jgi:phenylacetic acid degradation operon negative regulatory protein
MEHGSHDTPKNAKPRRPGGDETLSQMIESLRAGERSTPRALISTIMGDMILPHGGTIALSSLVRMGTALGLDERLTRTTAVRLVNDGWFRTERVGRQSYYTVTGEPLDRLMQYAPRIYAAYGSRWSGEWRFLIVVDGNGTPKQQAAFKADLQWVGAGQIAPGVFVYPFDEVDAIHRVMADHAMLDRTLLLSSPVRSSANAGLVAKLALRTWDLAAIEAEYERFLEDFSPILKAAQSALPGPEMAFVLRTTLILHYRKIALKDPQLPMEMLPSPWMGHAARNLCRALYFTILDPSEEFLREIGHTQFGSFGPVDRSVYERFSGPG